MKDYIVIGAGQAGLSIAYYLDKMGADYLVLDANNEVGEPWLKRWDSLKLFTPSEFNNLPGLEFPCKKGYYADKYEVANYLKKYVEHFNIPVAFNQKVVSLEKENEIFHIETGDKSYRSSQVIVATGPFHTPFTPPFYSKIDKSITQIHSEHYKNPAQLQDGETLVVGAGDSGVQILKEVSNDPSRKVYFSGNTNIGSIPQEFLGKTLWWWFSKLGVLTANKYSWFGKKLSTNLQPVIGTNVKELFSRKNIDCVGRTQDADGSKIVFDNKSVSSIKNIIWATGFKPNFNWIKGEQLDRNSYPENYRGISQNLEGLYYLGLPWLYTRGSATLGGVKNDAEYLYNHINEAKAKAG